MNLALPPFPNFLKIWLLSVVLFSVTPSAHAQVFLDFGAAGEFSDNFRKISASAQSPVQGSGVLTYDRTGTTSTAAIFMYDTTPGDSTTGTQSAFSTDSPLTVSYDFKVAGAGSSIGILFIDPSNNSNNLLALLNPDASGSLDRIRFFRDGTLSTAAPGTLMTQDQSISISGVSIGSANFANISATLSVSGTTPTISLTVNSVTVQQVFDPGDFDFSGGNVVVAFRLYDEVSGTSPIVLDNFAVIPEVSPAALVLAAGLLLGPLARVRRRRNRA